jgi:hemerythrin
MPLMTWDSKMSVHIREIDAQHKKLVELLNDFHDVMRQGKGKGKGKDLLGQTFNALLDYTKYHFGTEEKLFDQFGYPAATSHKKEHEDLTRQVVDLNLRFLLGDPVIGAEVMNFLKKWLTNHIMGSDSKYGSFLNEKGVV